MRSYNAARILMQNGFERVSVLAGGVALYKSMHYDKRMISNAKSADKSLISRKVSEAEKCNNSKNITPDASCQILDCCGLQCSGPIMKVNETISQMKEDEILKVSATDMGFAADIDSWCRRTGNTLLKTERADRENIVYIQKGIKKTDQNVVKDIPEGKTIIVFSGDLDKKAFLCKACFLALSSYSCAYR